jgi:molybdopterin converting factor small subunit
LAVTVKTLRPLSERIGGARIELDWTGGTLKDLIRHLAETRWSELESELKEADGELSYLFSVNGKVQRQLSTVIRDGDVVFIFAPVGGG